MGVPTKNLKATKLDKKLATHFQGNPKLSLFITHDKLFVPYPGGYYFELIHEISYRYFHCWT